MTAPLAPFPREVQAVLTGMLVFVVAIPFGRREDWIGRLAMSALFAVSVGLWALLIRGMAVHTLQWWRRRGERD